MRGSIIRESAFNTGGGSKGKGKDVFKQTKLQMKRNTSREELNQDVPEETKKLAAKKQKKSKEQ
jgi:hypothetical protein